MKCNCKGVCRCNTGQLITLVQGQLSEVEFELLTDDIEEILLRIQTQAGHCLLSCNGVVVGPYAANFPLKPQGIEMGQYVYTINYRTSEGWCFLTRGALVINGAYGRKRQHERI